MDISREQTFQTDIIDHLTRHGWLAGKSEHYDRSRALYPEDVIGFFSEAFPDQWQRFRKHYPQDSEQALLRSVARRLEKDGTLSVLRHGYKDRGTRIRLCQFKPDHDLNPETLTRYRQNRLRVVPELSYSPYARAGYNPRLDLALFVNGIPVATLELKSEFKQALDNAIRQYKKDRPPLDPDSRKPEPLLTFKRGALVHFAVSQFEAAMTTRLAGVDTFFLPFNRGTRDGGAGNDAPEQGYATGYLWQEVLQTDNLLKILGRFLHLEIQDTEDWQGRKSKKETMIFPRYHQWDVVNQLIDTSRTEGPGRKYLIQHSAGSGKSNSIAWTAHQLASLYDDAGSKIFDSIIVITDRTVLDAQLQDTIYQFEHAEGVVCRISREEGQGSKSEQLAEALETASPIIIVTIQTFPFVLEAIRQRTSLKQRRFAVIADEAHSSQTGSTSRKLRQVLLAEPLAEDEELSSEDVMNTTVAARYGSDNISYYAFTATPKAKTLELFGRCPNPELPACDDNRPEAFHVYSMRQAIGEGFILDVLKNYTTYKTAYQLAHRNPADDQEVDSKRAAARIAQWVRLNPHNIAQKTTVIVEHFRSRVMHRLDGHAKAMVVTGSRKEAVRYKLAFDKYIRDNGVTGPRAMVAFSGEVIDPRSGPQPFTETSMNPGLKGRDMRRAFETDEYQLMLVANKFQTGFDQPKLCAMYVDKKLAGVDCVQTLSRLNRTYPGKDMTFVLDFVNEPGEILAAFKPYYQTAELAGVSDPNLIYDLFDKLRAEQIYQWHEVEAFVAAFFDPKQGQDAIARHCKPALERWQKRYRLALETLREAQNQLKQAENNDIDGVSVENGQKSVRQAKEVKDTLDNFKKDLGSFVRFYEFMSQLIDYDDIELEKLSVFARHLLPLLREERIDADIDLSDVVMTHYRLSKIREQQLHLQEHGNVQDDRGEYRLQPTDSLGSAKAHDMRTELLSEIVRRMNELFAGDNLTESDLIHYANTIADKIRENNQVMEQLSNNSAEQAMLGDFPGAVLDAVIDSRNTHNDLAMQYLSDERIARGFARLLLDILVSAKEA